MNKREGRRTPFWNLAGLFAIQTMHGCVRLFVFLIHFIRSPKLNAPEGNFELAASSAESAESKIIARPATIVTP